MSMENTAGKAFDPLKRRYIGYRKMTRRDDDVVDDDDKFESDVSRGPEQLKGLPADTGQHMKAMREQLDDSFDYWKPAPLLERLAAEGGRFSSSE